MTREIKFRAWHKNWGSFANLREDSDFMAGFNEEGQIFIINNGYPDEKNRDFIIQQFTGLKDKNGNEIYEGDILSFKSDKRAEGGGNICGTYGFHKENCHEVFFERGCFYIANHQNLSERLNLWKRWGGLEIVGNCFENPELLEK
jgi:uncharacterized phage protein (TIGR01671 family)